MKPSSRIQKLPPMAPKKEEPSFKTPIYRLLRNYSLQQYTQKLVDMGYGFNYRKLAQLNQEEFKVLLSEIRILPGHQTRMQQLVQNITQMPEDSHSSLEKLPPKKPTPLKKNESPYKLPFTKPQFYSGDNTRPLPKVSKQCFKPKKLVENNKVKGIVLKDLVKKYERPVEEKKLRPKLKSLEKIVRENSSKKKIKKKQLKLDGFSTQNITKHFIQDDLDDICQCFSYGILEIMNKQQKLDKQQQLEQLSKDILELQEQIDKKYENINVEADEEVLSKEEEDIDNNNGENKEQNEDNQQISPELNEEMQLAQSYYEYYQFLIQQYKDMLPKYSLDAISEKSMEISIQQQQQSYESIDLEKSTLLKLIFNDINTQQEPNQDNVTDYTVNIIKNTKMEKEVTIIALIYIDRLIYKSGIELNNHNWKQIVFISLMLASKLWDDDLVEFSKLFPHLQINDLERAFLKLIDYNLQIKQQEYFKYHFQFKQYSKKQKTNLNHSF